jgi:hypothetical protein
MQTTRLEQQLKWQQIGTKNTSPYRFSVDRLETLAWRAARAECLRAFYDLPFDEMAYATAYIR